MILSGIMRRLPSRLGIMGINRRNRNLVYRLNPRHAFPNVDDKLRCKELLTAADIPVPETLHVIDGVSSLRCWETKVQDQTSFVIKPNRSFGGRGIVLVQFDGECYRASDAVVTAEELTAHIQRIMSGVFGTDNFEDKAYLEETVCNHAGLEPFLADKSLGVADIRLIYREERPIMAMLRVPTEASDGKANLHQGGLGIGVDLATGLSLGGCHDGQHVLLHPETDLPLAGIPIPNFNKMLALGTRICALVGLGYIGIDFVCDANKGALVLEVNARPGLSIQIANMAGLCRRLEQ